MTVYPFIEAERAAGHRVKRACQLLKVSRSAYYDNHPARGDREPSQRAQQDAELTKAIVEVFDDSRGTYGSPRVHAELAAAGRSHSRKRIARLMSAAGLRGREPKRWKTTTVPDPAAQAVADAIMRDFTVDAAAVNSRWCGDITYIATWEGWFYLATVIDIASRRIVGWVTADHLRTDLVEAALRNACESRRPPTGVIFHSDRGCQYTSQQFATAAGHLGVRLSVGRKGQCWDNAVSESFFATIKAELVDRRSWPTRAGLHTAIFDWIEGWYNTRRRHSSLGYLSPEEFERRGCQVEFELA
ncbi:IS3 family transposase [Kineococcus arenarius]|uniref:IS3 family transposase n=1 Tax=unclassified Kineococcus TaxID=2621656 RepID=UPI003D7E8EF4